jgi:hypothetical protein
MASKPKRKIIVQKKAVDRKHCSSKNASLMQDALSLNEHPHLKKNVRRDFVCISTVPITGTFIAMVVVWITNIILNLM